MSEYIQRYLDKSYQAQARAILKGNVSEVKIHQGFYRTIERHIKNPNLISFLSLQPVLAYYKLGDFIEHGSIILNGFKVVYISRKNGIKTNILYAFRFVLKSFANTSLKLLVALLEIKKSGCKIIPTLQTFPKSVLRISSLKEKENLTSFVVPTTSKELKKATFSIQQKTELEPKGTLVFQVSGDVQDIDKMYYDILEEVPVNQDMEVEFENLIDFDNNDLEFEYNNQDSRIINKTGTGYLVLLIPSNLFQPQRYVLNPDSLGNGNGGSINDLFFVYHSILINDINFNVCISKSIIRISNSVKFEFGKEKEPLRPIINEIKI